MCIYADSFLCGLRNLITWDAEVNGSIIWLKMPDPILCPGQYDAEAPKSLDNQKELFGISA